MRIQKKTKVDGNRGFKKKEKEVRERRGRNATAIAKKRIAKTKGWR